MELTGLYRVHIAAAGKAAAPIAIQRLENADDRKEYESSLCQKLREQPAFCWPSDSGSVISTWDSTAQAVIDVAESTLGRMHRSASRRVYVPNPEVETLSRRQREIRLLHQSGHHNPEELKREGNCIMHQIRTIQRSDAMERLDRIAERVEKAPTSAQMFTAAAQLKSGSGQRSPLIVERADGCILPHATDKASRVRDHFSLQFSAKTAGEIPPPSPHSLATPISESEVATALKRLRNGKACGPDKIPAELPKYGSEVLAPS